MPKHLFTIPHGTALPSAAGLPEGYPFRLDPDNVLYTISGGVFVALAGGGGGGGGGTPFSDDFTRADVLLSGNNGWFESVAADTADFKIVGNAVKVPTGSIVDFGNSPILHVRDGADPNIADVTITASRPDNTGNAGLVPFSDDGFAAGFWMYYDGTLTAGFQANFAGGWSLDWDVDHGVAADFTGGSATWRYVYNDTTKKMMVYFNGVLAYEINNCQTKLDTVYGAGTYTIPALALMPNCGFLSNAGENIDTFDSVVCA
jgi:hypothetical protein